MQKAKLFALVIAITLLLSPTLLLAQGSDAGDQVMPSDVENVKAIPGDKEITLTWDVATDNTGVTSYKIYYGTQSVKVDGATYELPPVLVEDVVTHTITGLENGKAYYFAVTALDATGNESPNYSLEVSATPQEGLKNVALEDDGKSPEISKVEAKEKDMVKVEFSEPVILPIEDPEKAFTIEPPLTAKEAELDPEDELGKTVLLLTENQESGKEYELTVGIEIEDHFGNPVIKDKGDKMKFVGFQIAIDQLVAQAGQPETQPAAPKDETPPTITEINAPVGNQVKVTFSEPVKVGKNAKDHFSITKGDTTLPITNASLSKDGLSIFLNTEPQQMGKYELRVSGITDETGNELETVTLEFDGKGPDDTTPPEDVTELIAQLATGKKNAVELMWKKSKDTAGDLADQLLYQSENQSQPYGDGKSLGKATEKTEVKNLTGGKEYTFKITAKDLTGNESKGTIISIRLPETGPALPLAFAFSVIASYIYKKRKKK